MNLDDFSYEENDRRYINPQVALDESNQFIDNLRSAQQQDTAQIQQDTYDLGTEVPSNLGGLVGGEGYFKSRYQTPQTSSVVADLRAAAQAQALSDAIGNELAKAKKRYNDAYRAAAKRSQASGTGGTTSPSGTEITPDVDWGNTESDIEKIEVGGVGLQMSLLGETASKRLELENKINTLQNLQQTYLDAGLLKNYQKATEDIKQYQEELKQYQK